MDENQNQTSETKIIHHENDCHCGVHPFWKYLFIGLAVFAGTLGAAYAIIDWHMKSMLTPFLPNPVFLEQEKFANREFHKIDRAMKDETKIINNNAALIHLEKQNNSYIITIDLDEMHNKAQNIDVKTDKNTLVIESKVVDKSKNGERISKFQQTYVFGDDVNLKNLQKSFNGKDLIITIPISDSNSD